MANPWVKKLFYPINNSKLYKLFMNKYRRFSVINNFRQNSNLKQLKKKN